MEYRIRKPNRLQGYNYRSAGYYFLTLCTQNKKKLFWSTDILTDGKPQLSPAGKIAEKSLIEIPMHYTGVQVDKFAIMPNHVHVILTVAECEDGKKGASISGIMAQYKGAVTKEIGTRIWQKGFHDHIIRGEQDYRTIWEYIDMNPSKWTDDCYFE